MMRLIFIKDSSTKESYVHKSGAWNDELQDYNKSCYEDKKKKKLLLLILELKNHS